MNTINIDLSQEKRGLVPLDVSWPIRLPEPEKPGFFQKLFGANKQETPAVSLIVVVDDVKARHIKCNVDELFVISYSQIDKYCYQRPLRVDMSSNDMPFTLSLNTAAIYDCEDLSKDLTISAKLVVYDGNVVYGNDILFKDLQGFSPGPLPDHGK